MKNRGLIITLIVFMSILAIGIVGIMVKMLNGGFMFNFGHKISNELVIDEKYDNNFEIVSIESDASDVEIKHSSDGEFRVLIYGDKERTSVNTDNSRLKVHSEAKKCFGICWNQKIAKIEIYIPESFKGKIEVVNKYGDITIDDFEKSDIKIEEDCGDVEIEAGRNVDVKNSYGDVTVNRSVTLKVKESCGDVKVGTVDDVEIDNNYGDIKIDTVESYMNLKNDCGDIRVDTANLKKDSKVEDNLGSIKIGRTNEVYIDASTSLGDIKVNNNFRTADVTLKIKNDCGDIRVDN